MRPQRSSLLVACFFALTLAGCGLAGLPGSNPFVLLSLIALLAAGCSQALRPMDGGPLEDGETPADASRDAGPDASDASSVPDTSNTPDAAPDAAPDAGGIWERCCENGRISTCFCPAGWACNYGWFTDCGNNVCTYGPNTACPGADAGPDASNAPDVSLPPDASTEPDAGGNWEACCDNGQISTCFCPGGAECNYGWFTDCGNNTCTYGVDTVCPAVDAGPPPDAVTEPDAGGSWESCCQGGVITTCFCPAGVACNYGWYTDCGNDVCTFGPDTTCPGDGGVDAGVADGG